MMIKQRSRKNKGKKVTFEDLQRKPYVKPQLTEYGQIEKLTQGGQSIMPDGVNTRHRA